MEINRKGTMSVVIMEGRDLPKMDRNGLSDPFVKMKFGDMEWVQTSVKKQTLNPIWLEEFFFPVFDLEPLDLEIWDKDPHKFDFMGRAMIDMSVLYTCEVFEGWVDIESEEELGGQIKIRLKYFSDVVKVPSLLFLRKQGIVMLKKKHVFMQIIDHYLKWWSGKKDNHKTEMLGILDAEIIPVNKKDKSIDGIRIKTERKSISFSVPKEDCADWILMLTDAIDDTVIDLESEGYLNLTFIEARNLPPSDPNGKSDPFCVINVENEQRRTTVKKVTLNPVWNEHFDFLISNIHNNTVRITLFDEDKSNMFTSRKRRVTTELLGNVDLELIESEDVIDEWFDITLHHKFLSHNKIARLRLSYTYQINERMNYEQKVFGIPFLTLLEREHFEFPLPRVIIQIIDTLREKGLEAQGIFRLSGDANHLNALRKSIDMGEEVDFTSAKTHTLAGLIKLYFREMPSPIMTTALFRDFLSTIVLQGNVELCKGKMSELIQKLPQPNQKALKYLILFFLEITQCKEQNKMDENNIAVVFGPNLLSTNSTEDLLKIAQVPKVINFLLHYPDILDTIEIN